MAKLGKEARKKRGRAPKEKIVSTLASALGYGNGFLLADNKGLNAAEITTLRSKMRAQKVAVKVSKNSLIKIALKQKGIDPAPLEHLLVGPTVLLAGKEDAIVAAKALLDFAKGNEKFAVKGGYFENQVLDAKGVDTLSKLPGRPELLARMMGSMKAPAQNVVFALHQAQAKVVFAVDAIRRKMENAA